MRFETKIAIKTHYLPFRLCAMTFVRVAKNEILCKKDIKKLIICHLEWQKMSFF